MTGLDPTHQLAALIRVQVAALRRRKETSPGAGQRPAVSGRVAETPDLAAAVAQRIRSIEPDDPQRERKALRMFLDTVLLCELGQQLAGDPAFALMVDHVQKQMQDDPELARACADAARLLLKSAQAGG